MGHIASQGTGTTPTTIGRWTREHALQKKYAICGGTTAVHLCKTQLLLVVVGRMRSHLEHLPLIFKMPTFAVRCVPDHHSPTAHLPLLLLSISILDLTLCVVDRRNRKTETQHVSLKSRYCWIACWRSSTAMVHDSGTKLEIKTVSSPEDKQTRYFSSGRVI